MVQIREVVRAVSAAGLSVKAPVRWRLRRGQPAILDPGRWHERACREMAADMLTQHEDDLELRAGSRAAAARGALREVRRRLEVELWP